MNDIEAVGEPAQGGKIARAAEPEAGEATGHTRESACLNCGTPLVGSHCHACGQRGHQHRTLGAFFHDLLHGVLHFEGKIWRTLPLLLWNPGKLTREYVDGRRASYVSPIALFLFVVFLTFAAINATGHRLDFGDEVTLDGERVPIATADAELTARLKTLQAQRSAAAAARRSTAAIDEELAAVRGALDMVEAIENDDIEAFAEQLGSTEATADEPAGFSIDRLWRKAKENPALLIYKLQANAYKFSWLLIPISVPFVWLLFPFSRRFRLYDHTVFVTYSLSFMMIMLALGTTFRMQTVVPLALVLTLYVPVHLYRQVRVAYGTTRVGALWRTAALLLFAWVALAMWAAALLGLVLS